MKRFAVVVNDCAAPPVAGILPVRSQDTAFGQRNFTLRFDELAEGLPAQLTERQLDWLELLGHLFAIDLACERGQGDVDWSRSIRAWLPVRDPDFWTARQSAIEGIWTDLTDDELELRFEQATTPAGPPRQGRDPFPSHDGVALLSGGQDSFVGALDLMTAGRRPLLLSHTASGATNTAQNAVEAHLRVLQADVVRMKLSARKTPDRPFPGAEPSQRSRTFLFVGAACLVAAAGSNQVWLNENGIMALHLPLTAARVGSLSTHTAAPPILERMADLASDVLASAVAVDNELVALTKAAGRRARRGPRLRLPARRHRLVLADRTHPYPLRHLRPLPVAAHLLRDPRRPRRHVRRRRLRRRGLPRRRPRPRHLTHLISLVQDLLELPDLELEYEYPELLSGQPALSLGDAIVLHRRWADEASAVLFAHPVPAGLR